MRPDPDGANFQPRAATLPCGPDAPALARKTVSGWLDGGAYGELRHDACLLVSELVTNSVMHARQAAGAPLELRASAEDGVVRFEVKDLGRNGAVARRTNGDGGFGLHFVELLAERWGVTHEHGTLVWFE